MPETETESERKEEGEEKKEKKKDNYFEKEYKRLKDKLEKMKQEIKRMKDERQETTFTPNIYNSLEPYSNTKTVETVMSAPTNTRDSPVARATSIGVCEPWESLRIDQTVLPKGETHVLTPPHDRSQDNKKNKKEGMSHFPKIRNVNIDVSKYVNKQLDFDDVPSLRKDLRETYTAEASAKIEEDYNQTMEDYTRMQLDVCLDELKPPNRDIVRDAMVAYLQNTPGSRKALFHCLRESDKKQKEKEAKEKEEKEKNDEGKDKEEEEKKEKTGNETAEEKSEPVENGNEADAS